MLKHEFKFAARAFCAAAPTVWNSLGVHTHSADMRLTFKNRLTTELFQSCYSQLFWRHRSTPDLLVN